jgi:G3E family GTPase
LLARLESLNPAAPVIEARNASVTQLIDCGLYDPERKIPDVRRWLADEAYAAAHDHHHHHHDVNRHDERIRAFALASEQAIPYSAFEMFLDLIRSMHGPDLLRVKGIVKIAETPDQPIVIHGVQHVFHRPRRSPPGPTRITAPGSCSSSTASRRARSRTCSTPSSASPGRISRTAPR